MAVGNRRRVWYAKAAAAGIQFGVLVAVNNLRRTKASEERQKVIHRPPLQRRDRSIAGMHIFANYKIAIFGDGTLDATNGEVMLVEHLKVGRHTVAIVLVGGVVAN